jgi:two-component system, sensor histidine kinase
VTVSDSGCGVRLEALPALFAPFQQADASMRRARGGAGVGLTLVAGFVEAAGGHMFVRSAPGEGMSVRMVLPWGGAESGGAVDAVRVDPPELFEEADDAVVTVELSPVSKVAARGPVPAAPAAAAAAAAAAPAPAATPDDERKDDARLRVLVVDDSAINRRVLSRMLARLGHEVAGEARDGREAVEAVARARDGGLRVDVVLMDCHMPVLDGFEAAREIRALEAASASEEHAVPIYAVTADTQAGVDELAAASGMSRTVLGKPFTMAQLKELLVDVR